MKLLGSIYIAIAILVVTAAIGWYVDISHEQMHQRHRKKFRPVHAASTALIAFC